jgi:pimeloyl-ACP methyl ester carboxylesterase
VAAEIERRGFVGPDGLTLIGDVGGPPDAPLVVLLHGGGQTRHSWSGAMRALLQRGYRVVSYDARGHGESDWSSAGAYDLADRVADLRAVLGDTHARFALVGASLGGGTALLALADGLRPDATVLVDIVPDAEPAGIGRIVQFMRGNADGFATLEDAAAAVAAYNPDRPAPSDPSGLMRNLRPADDGRLHWHWDPQIVAEKPDDHRARLQAAARTIGTLPPSPLLVVRGLHSDVVSDAGLAQFRRTVPWLDIFDVPGAGHMVAGDRNDAFNAGVIAFLAQHLPVDTQHG